MGGPGEEAQPPRSETVVITTPPRPQRRTLTCFCTMNLSKVVRGMRRMRLRRLWRVSGVPRSITPSACPN